MTAGQRAILPLLTNRLDRDEQAGLSLVTLADVERPGRTWTVAPWECDRCGDLYDVQPDHRGRMYDGDLLVCVSCGSVARVSADVDGAHAADPHGVLTEGAHADLYARELVRTDFDAGHDPGDEHRDPP